MKKYLVPAGIVCTAALAGTFAYRKLKGSQKDKIIYYPMGRYVVDSNDVLRSNKELVDGSDVVLLGRVNRKTGTRWNNKDNKQPQIVSEKDTIFFDYMITPIKIYKGSAPADGDIRLRSFEGEAGGYIIEDSCQPKLKEGQEVLLFLKTGSRTKSDEDEFYTVNASPQGIFEPENGSFMNCNGILTEDELAVLAEEAGRV